MRPPRKEFEKVATGVEIVGIIDDVLYHENHTFPGFEGKEDTVATAIRFKFVLEGAQYPKYSRWMRLSLNAKATLYKKYASALIEGLEPDADVDLDILKGMAISTTWKDNGDFQNLETISAIGPKIKQDAVVPVVDLNDVPPEPTEEEGPVLF